jgi:hypothetical protein
MLGSRSNEELKDLVWIRAAAKANTGQYESRDEEIGMWVPRENWREAREELRQEMDEFINLYTAIKKR